jgi:hypothetical protein
MDHDGVRLMLMPFTVIDPNLVNLIRENHRYTKMSSEDFFIKFVSGRLVVSLYYRGALLGASLSCYPEGIMLQGRRSLFFNIVLPCF